MLELETERLRLRQWRPDDLEPYARLLGDPDVMRYMPTSMTPAQARAQIERFTTSWRERGFGHWVVTLRGEDALIGRVGLLHHDDWTEDPDNVEVGWLLDKRFWGRGLATEAARASLRHGFGELGLPRIISITVPDNRASRRVMEKLGLTLAGRAHWRRRDHLWYRIDREEWAERSGDGR